MPSRILRDGRTVWATKDWRDFRPSERFDPTPVVSPLTLVQPLRTGVPFIDPDDGLTYRVVERLDLAEGWATGATLCRWLRCTFPRIVCLIREGKVDAAMERGSPTKRYRILDGEILIEAARKTTKVTRSVP